MGNTEPKAFLWLQTRLSSHCDMLCTYTRTQALAHGVHMPQS